MSHRIVNLLRWNRRNILFLAKNTSATRVFSRTPSNIVVAKAELTTVHRFYSNHERPVPEKNTKSPKQRSTPGDNLNTYAELYENMNLYFQANNRIHPDIFSKIIRKLEASINKDDSVFLLEVCSDYLPNQTCEQRMVFFHQIWNHLKKTIALDQSHYLTALKVYQRNRQSLSSIQEIFIDCPVKNDPKIYEGLIQLACESGNVQGATEILSEMSEKKISLTENVFNSLILGHSRNKDLNGCQSVLQTMNAANITPSTETMTELICANIENGEFKEAEKIIAEHESRLNAKQIIKIVQNLINANQIQIMEKLMKLLPDEIINVKELTGHFKNICIELVYGGETDKAIAIINAFPVPKFNDNEDTDTFAVFLINELIKFGEKDPKIIEICQHLIDSGKNARALHIACEIVLRSSPNNASIYLEALSVTEKLRPHYFWPILAYSFHHSGEIGILNTLKKMSDLGVECDNDTLTKYCLPRLSICLNDDQKAVQTLESCGLKTSQFLTPMIGQMIMQHKQKEIIKLCELYQSKLDTTQFVFPMAYLAVKMPSGKFYPTFSKLTQCLIHKSENASFDLAGQFLMEMLVSSKRQFDIGKLTGIIIELHAMGIKISSIAADVLSNHLSNSSVKDIKNVDNARKYLHEMINKNLNVSPTEISESNLAHPRDMSFDELECHLIELEGKKLNARGVLRRLLQMSVRENRLERAVELKKKCELLKVNISPGMQASIIELYIKLKDVNEAEKHLRNIKKMFPGFLIDEHKIIDLAALLVEHKQLDKACDLLKERSLTTRIMGGENVHKNIWNLLMKTAAFAALPENSSTTAKNKTKELFTLLNRYGYCKPQNAVLGPIIREHIYKNQIKLAVAEFREIAEKYKKTPLLFELMSILVNISNGKELIRYKITESEAKEMLQHITSISGEIHNGVNANSTLLLAFAESGTENQLRKLLINPEFRINPDALMKNCEHLSSSGKMETILKLAKACRGLGHILREDNLYNLLMDNFVKENNYAAGLELFEKLEADDDLKISQEFLKSLVNMLKINKIEIPTGIALRTQLRN